MNLIETLNWRYAAKQYSTKIVDQETISQIIEATNLSASSTGLQPYRLVVIDNKELQAKLGEGSFNQQIATASHLFVFAAFTNITQEHIDNYMQLTAETREIPVEALVDFKSKLEYYLLQSRNDEENLVWSTKQAYIGLGTALIAAADKQVDTTPMEGFDQAKFDELLGLKAKGLTSVVVLALGYRSEDDAFSQLKKVRLPEAEFVV